MRATKISAVLATLAAIGIPALARAELVETFKADNWDGLAFTNDATGKFSHCAVFAANTDGLTLYVSSEVAGGWYLSVANKQWTLTAGSQYPVGFQVDQNSPISGNSAAIGTFQIGLPVPAGHPFIDELRRGTQLTLSFQGVGYSFPLTNSNKAISAAQECVQRNVKLGTHSAVAAAANAPAPGSAATPAPGSAPAPAPAPTPPVDHNRPSAATGPQQRFGPWVVTATSDPTGGFVNCTAFGVYGQDQLILSLFPDGVWTFGLYRSAWTLNTNETYYLWYNIDAPANVPGTIKRPVDAAEPKRIFFEVNEIEDIIARMAHGAKLNISVRGLSSPPEDYSFSLDQAGDAFAATQQCVANRPKPPPPPPPPPPPQPAPQAESAPPVQPPAQVAAGDQGNPQPAPPQQLPPLGATTIEPLSVPGWQGAAYALDDGTFTHCGIEAEYQNGATLGVARTAGGDLLLRILQKEWSLQIGAQMPLTYSLGGAKPVTATVEGQVTEANRMVARIGGDAAATAALHDATQMNIKAAGKELAFDISDIGPGVEAINACAAKHGGKG